ncbi:MAG TPA: OmpA family protein [Gemmatimonadales bacterium]|nr:OmpA family protein [Gemmatimonadales bacterium]
MRQRAAVFLIVALACSAISPVAAQNPRRYEVGLFGSYTKYDKTFSGLGSEPGGGARFAFAVSSKLTLEVEALFQQPVTGLTSGELSPVIGAASLIAYPFNKDRLSLYVLGGYSRLDFGNAAPYDFTDGGFHGGAGAKFFISSRMALRFEGRGIFTPQTKSSFASGSVTHIVGSAGLAFFQSGGGAPSGDEDHDGVSDKKDACPGTPPGAKVDSKGCPVDDDKDGVVNGIDACPGTPVGATVDAKGCPHDSDGDKVFDGIDQCPDTPPGVTVDAKGCPPDSDGDGVNDGLDKCPNTPAGATVDATGCPIDSDHDNVWDGLDKCPDTPAGAVVDATGCPVDSDGDRVPDGIDRCPDTPPNTPVDSYGCPADSDHDGVGDGFDKCPNTPPGTQVDANGCPMAKDSDGDGVIDPEDRCPNTPNGSRVDEHGCLLLFETVAPAVGGAAAATPARPTLILHDVNFETGRSVLTTSSYAILDQVAGSLVANPEIRIEIAGYTDATGSPRMNLGLSMARAGAVRAYLARRGVSPYRMRAQGYGASGFIAPNTTPEGRAQNRRVELHKLN